MQFVFFCFCNIGVEGYVWSENDNEEENIQNDKDLLNRNINQKENRMFIWDTCLDTYFQYHMKAAPSRCESNLKNRITTIKKEAELCCGLRGK